MKIHQFTASATCAMLLFVIPALAGESPNTATAVEQFQNAVDDYVQLHRRLEKRLPRMRVTEHAQEIFDASDALAAALIAARPAAREGDLFAPRVAVALRERIAAALTAHGFQAEEVIAAGDEEAPLDAAWPVVNGRFPSMRGAAMWPCIIEALPPLPDELQYRIVGRDLILVDVHANLVVDILREALR
jgi:hypothetical protein